MPSNYRFLVLHWLISQFFGLIVIIYHKLFSVKNFFFLKKNFVLSRRFLFDTGFFVFLGWNRAKIIAKKMIAALQYYDSQYYDCNITILKTVTGTEEKAQIACFAITTSRCATSKKITLFSTGKNACFSVLIDT